MRPPNRTPGPRPGSGNSGRSVALGHIAPNIRPEKPWWMGWASRFDGCSMFRRGTARCWACRSRGREYSKQKPSSRLGGPGSNPSGSKLPPCLPWRNYPSPPATRHLGRRSWPSRRRHPSCHRYCHLRLTRRQVTACKSTCCFELPPCSGPGRCRRRHHRWD